MSISTTPAPERTFAELTLDEYAALARSCGNRYLSAACHQMIYAKEAKALGDISKARTHLEAAKKYWLRAQEPEQEQTKQAIDKIQSLGQMLKPGYNYTGRL